jgi:uncharacterized phage protein gp47/JayE
MNFGVTPQGFVIKTLSEIQTEKRAQLDAAFPEFELDYSPFSYFGLVPLGIDAQREYDHWQKMEEVYYSFWIDTSEGVTLDRVVALRGVARIGEVQSIVDLVFTGEEGASIPVSTFCETSANVQFVTTQSGTISGGTATVTARAVVAGVDGNVAPDTIQSIITVVPNITAVNNPSSATGGRGVETDAELRARYKLPNSSGGSSAPAIQAVFLSLEGVITAIVFENNTDVTVGVLTPHSIRVIVEGATEAQISSTLLSYKPAGIETIGANVINTVDNEGTARTFRYDTPTDVDIYCDSEFTIDTTSPGSPADPAAWLSTYGDQAKENIIEAIGGTGLTAIEYPGGGISADVEVWKINAEQLGLPWVTGNIVTTVAKTASPTLESVVIADDERAKTDSTKVNVTAV